MKKEILFFYDFLFFTFERKREKTKIHKKESKKQIYFSFLFSLFFSPKSKTKKKNTKKRLF
jgi:hypothetical protein